MSELSRRGFIRASVVGVGVGAAVVEGCSGEEGMAPGGQPPPGAGNPQPPPPTGGGGQPPMGTDPPGMPPTNPPPGMQPPPTNPPPGMQPPTNPPPGMQPPTNPPPTNPPPTNPPPGMMPPPGAMPPGGMGPAGMPLRALGKTGLMVSIVGFGSGSQYLRASEAEAERLIHRAIELGINYFDTAVSYGSGSSQRRLGKYLVPMYRNKVVLVSKIMDRTAAGARRQLDQALRDLATDHLDILHFHEIGSVSEVDRIMAPGGAYEVYMAAKAQGVVKHIGVSGHSTAAILMNALARIKPDVMMCPQNAARENGFTDMVIPFAQQNGIGVLGMKVTAQDALIRNGVKAEELVRYSLSLPVSSMIIGMRSLAVLESCAMLARTLKPLTPAEMMGVTGRLAAVDARRYLPYRRWGYRDGTAWV
jgi:uncharacterized protein